MRFFEITYLLYRTGYYIRDASHVHALRSETMEAIMGTLPTSRCNKIECGRLIFHREQPSTVD